MLAKLVRELPGDGYVYEPKWDGFRCLAARAGREVELHSRHGRALARYFPEVVEALARVEPEAWAIDGELLALVGGRFDFASLMARLHPSDTRVRELVQATPAVFVAFDLLEAGGEDLRGRGFAERRERLEALFARVEPPPFLTPATSDRAVAERWLAEFRGGGLDGVVAKHRDQPYEPGARTMLKVKHERTAECVVAGMRANAEPPAAVSLLLGLYDDADTLEHIGVVSSFGRERGAALLQELAPLAVRLAGHPWEHGFLTGGGPMGRLKGAAGRWVPGMEMDWIPLAPTRVLEVSYTQVDGHRLRHPAKFVRWRPDRDARSCLVDQLDTPLPRVDQVLSGN